MEIPIYFMEIRREVKLQKLRGVGFKSSDPRRFGLWDVYVASVENLFYEF